MQTRTSQTPGLSCSLAERFADGGTYTDGSRSRGRHSACTDRQPNSVNNWKVAFYVQEAAMREGGRDRERLRGGVV